MDVHLNRDFNTKAKKKIFKTLFQGISNGSVTLLLLFQPLLLTVLMPAKVFASGEEIISSGNISGETDAYIPVTGVSVTGAGGDTVPVSLSVPNGQLSMTTTTGLTFSTDPTGSTIGFSGTITNVNAALATLRYRTTNSATITLTASLALPGEVFFPDNGHLYEIVEDTDSSITANDAKIAAEARTKYGSNGYLVTVTSQEELDYIGARLSGDGWMGASDAGAEGDWKWITGPEAGTSFWSGLANGSPVSGRFSNWAFGEPNDSTNEDCAQFYANGSGWNDLHCSNNTLGYYVVEYGAPGDLPVPFDSTTQLDITTTFPDPNDVTIGSCADLITVENNSNNHRYDNLSLTADIDCTGQNLEPMFNDEDPDLGLLGFRGMFDGQGHTISGISVTATGGNVGLIGATNGATIGNLTLSGGTVDGEYCTGALVGSAYDTAIDNVNSSVDVSGDYSVGGLVGCFYATNDNSSLLNSDVTGDASGSETIGGLIGVVETHGGNSFQIEDNSSTGQITASDYTVGGLVGDMESYEADSTISISGNSASGVNGAGTQTMGGLIGAMEAGLGATIHIEDNVTSGNLQGQDSVGGLVGYGFVEEEGQVTITNSVTTTNVSAVDGNAGGLVGYFAAEGETSDTKLVVSNSSTAGNISGSYQIGGLVGYIGNDSGEEDLSFSSVHAGGDITGTDASTGGLIGEANGVTIFNADATGAVSGGEDTGGIVGAANSETHIEESYATGNVEGTDQRTGGLVGKNANSTVAASYATGDVSGTSRVGGLTGASGGTIVNSYARGSVTGDDNVGGLSGRCGGEILDSYATGLVDGNSDTGGLVGFEDGCETENSFWDTETTSQGSSVVGTGKSTSEMKSLVTFTSTETVGLSDTWDFNTIWSLTAAVNDGYPCLLWQSGSCGVDQSQDQDNDGVSNIVEDAGPNSGDANNDGVADSQQSNVSSYVNSTTGRYTVLAVPSACSITAIASNAETSNVILDAGFSYPAGLMNFTLNCGTPGYAADVTQLNYGININGLVVRKHNPNTNAYFTITSATLSQLTIAGNMVASASFQIIDGGNLDTDGTANGTIVDPVGFAQGVVGAPNTGLGGRQSQ